MQISAYGYEYDAKNNLTQLVEVTNGVTVTSTYTYDDDNRVTSTTTGNASVHYTYDAYGRITQQVTKNGSTTVLTESFTYIPNSSRVSTYATTAGGTTTTYTYTYDDNGNIATIFDGTYTTTYTYDSANQLMREDNEEFYETYFWNYDSAGNIVGYERYESNDIGPGCEMAATTYSYSDGSWGDMLTSINDKAVISDEIGNITAIADVYGDHELTYTWQHGRQLATFADYGGTWEFTYNSDGLRTKRTNGTTTYNYVYNGSKLVQMTVDGHTLYFSYDTSGIPLSVNFDGTEYFYVTNLQGDVTGIVDASGTTVAAYCYDAWGLPVSCGESTYEVLEILNPLRYRGYVYDSETELYYLQSRYYSPHLCRFISPDIFVATGQDFVGNNMFAYCGNDPVNHIDSTGAFYNEVDVFFSFIWECLFFCLNQPFGAGSSTTVTIFEHKTAIIPDPWPITITQETQISEVVTESGDATRPISVYANYDAKNPVASSSAGLNVTVNSFNLNVNLALDDVGIYLGVINGNTKNSIGLKIDLSSFKIGIEKATETRSEKRITTHSTNVSISGWVLLMGLVYVSTGQVLYSSQ